MKTKFLYAFILFSLPLAACRQEATTINQNTLPVVSATATPHSTAPDNGNLSNVNNAPERNANQIAKPSPSAAATPRATASPTAAPNVSNTPAKYKNYTAKGVIKAIDIESGSVTIDHEDITGYMVGMEMSFPVVNKIILKNLKVGDKVSFVLETGVGVERIVSIRKF